MVLPQYLGDKCGRTDGLCGDLADPGMATPLCLQQRGNVGQGVNARHTCCACLTDFFNEVRAYLSNIM